jgi:hypothetical protein
LNTIRQAQQTNALRQAEMQQLQQQQMRENQLREALRRPGVVSPTGQISREAAFAGVDPGIAPELEEKIAKAEDIAFGTANCPRSSNCRPHEAVYRALRSSAVGA